MKKTLQYVLTMCLLLSCSSLMAQITIKHNKCKGAKQGKIVIIPPTGSTKLSYNLKDISNTKTISTGLKHGKVVLPDDATDTQVYGEEGLPSGEYILQIEGELSTCSTEIIIKIKEPSQIGATVVPILKPNNKTNISCKGGNDGEIKVAPSGGIGPYKIKLYKGTVLINTKNNVNSGEDALFTDLSAGNDYEVIITDVYECDPVIKKVDMTEPHEELSLTTGTKNLTCFGVNQGEISYVVKGGTAFQNVSSEAFYNVKLFKGSIQFGSTQNTTSGTFNNLPAGNYKIEVKDLQQCTFTSTNIEITSPSKLQAENLNYLDLKCNGASNGKISLEASGGIPYPSGKYDFTLKDKLGNTLNTIVEVSKADFLNLVAGEYQIEISDKNNCTNTISVTLTQPASLLAVLTPQRVGCKGEETGSVTAKITGGTAPYTIQWFGGNDSPISSEKTLALGTSEVKLENIGQGTYFLKVKDINNCPINTEWYTSLPAKVAEPTQNLGLIISKNNPVSCYGNSDGSISLKAQGGWGGYRYSKDNINFQSINQFTGLVAGEYTFYLKDAGGCVTSIDTEVIEPTPLLISLAKKTNILCKGTKTGKIQIDASGGNGNYEVSVDGLNWVLGTTIDNLGVGNYTVQVRDSLGCTQTITNITLTEPATSLSGSIVETTSSTCGKPNGSATAKAEGGVSPYTYQWYNASNNIVGTEVTFTGLAGTYKLIIRDVNNCEYEINNVNISDLGAPKVKIEQKKMPTCHDSNDATLFLTVTEAKFPIKITFDNKDMGTFTATTNTLEIPNLAKGTYTIKLSDQSGCQTNVNAVVDGPDELLINLVKRTLPNCFGESSGALEVAITGGTAPYTYAWSMPEGVGKTNLVNGLASGNYSLRVVDAKNCETSIALELLDPEPIQAEFPTEIKQCIGQKSKLDAGNEGSTYVWTGPFGFTSTNKAITTKEDGRYEVIITTPKGCTATLFTDVISTNDVLKSDFVISTNVTVGDTLIAIEISEPLPESILWKVPEGVIALQPADSYYQEFIVNEIGEFTFQLQAKLGDCISSFEKTVTVKGKTEVAVEQQAELGYQGVSLNAYNLYPNPTTGEFTLRLDFDKETQVYVNIYDAKGNVIKQDAYNQQDKYEITYNLSNHDKGLYFVSILFRDQEKVLKILLQ